MLASRREKQPLAPPVTSLAKALLGLPSWFWRRPDHQAMRTLEAGSLPMHSTPETGARPQPRCQGRSSAAKVCDAFDALAVDYHIKATLQGDGVEGYLCDMEVR